MPYVRNKNTGETKWVPDEQPPMNPEFPYKGPQAQANLGQTGAQTGKAIADTARTHVQTQGDQLDNQTKTRNLNQNPISAEDQALINKMREGQGDLAGVLRDITGAQAAVDRFKPSPGKGIVFGAGTADDDDNILTAGLKAPIGFMLPDDKQDDYQTLLGLQNQGVLNSQLAQKGPQTESDAVRMKLTGVSPNKGRGPNAQLLAEQQYDVMMKQRRPAFYEYWANQLGSTHALNNERKSADQVWAEQYQNGLQQMRGDSRYRRAAGLRDAPRRPQVDSLLKKYGVK